MPAQGCWELPVKSSQKSWKNKENICNTLGCSSYQSLEGIGGWKLEKAKENKNKPQNTQEDYLYTSFFGGQAMKGLSSCEAVEAKELASTHFYLFPNVTKS